MLEEIVMILMDSARDQAVVDGNKSSEPSSTSASPTTTRSCPPTSRTRCPWPSSDPFKTHGNTPKVWTNVQQLLHWEGRSQDQPLPLKQVQHCQQDPCIQRGEHHRLRVQAEGTCERGIIDMSMYNMISRLRTDLNFSPQESWGCWGGCLGDQEEEEVCDLIDNNDDKKAI